MLRQLLKTLLILFLILFPFLAGILLSRYSPYHEGNSMLRFIIIYTVFTLIVNLLLIYSIYLARQPFSRSVLQGILLFFIGCIMMGIAGLAEAPDLSSKMLEHPEREHFRYILLFIGTFFFGLYFIHVFATNSLQLNTTARWIMIGLFAIAMVELIWEFSHHYLYPEGLKEWISKGNNADDFNKNYDDWKSITTGAVGRFFIYILMLLLSLRSYKLRHISIWNPIITSFMCVLGIISSIAFFLYAVYTIEIPKELGFLMLFFIPGIPFLIMYWIGIGLLTRPSRLMNQPT